MTPFGSVLRNARLQSGMSIADLERQLGMRANGISRIERGWRRPTDEFVDRSYSVLQRWTTLTGQQWRQLAQISMRNLPLLGLSDHDAAIVCRIADVLSDTSDDTSARRLLLREQLRAIDEIGGLLG